MAEGTAPMAGTSTGSAAGAEGAAGHPGSLVLHGRGHMRHYWGCCGQKFDDSLVAELALLVEDRRGALKEAKRALQQHESAKTSKTPKGNLLRHFLSSDPSGSTGGAEVGEKQRAVNQAEQHLADAQKGHDERVEELRVADPCSARERSAWADTGLKPYMQHMYELIKTEEVYVRRLHFALHAFYEPLSTGSHHAPQLSVLELQGLFSTLVQDSDADGEKAENVGGCNDIVSFHSDVFLKLLYEEEQSQIPDVGSIFQRMVAGRPMIEHMNMYAAYAAHHSTVRGVIQRLEKDNSDFTKFLEQEQEHWKTKPAQNRLRRYGLRNLNVSFEKTLFVPLQRLMRYKLLLSDLVDSLPQIDVEKVGPTEKHKRSLQRSLGQLDEIVAAVNAFTANTTSVLRKVAQCAELMGPGGGRFRQLSGFDLVKPGRIWLQGDGEDAMWFEWDPVTLRMHSKPSQLMLFNDMIVVARPSRSATHPLSYREHLPLRGMALCHRAQDRLVLKCVGKGIRVFLSEFQLGSVECRNHVVQWMGALTLAVAAADEAFKATNAMTGTDHSVVGPHWTATMARSNPKVLARALFESGILGTHKQMFGRKSHENSFAASEAISWMMYADIGTSRARCVRLGRTLVERQLIQPVTENRPFDDRYILFRFVSKPAPMPPPLPPMLNHNISDDQFDAATLAHKVAKDLVADFKSMLANDDSSRKLEWAELSERKEAEKHTFVAFIQRKRNQVTHLLQNISPDACFAARQGRHIVDNDHYSNQRHSTNLIKAANRHVQAHKARHKHLTIIVDNADAETEPGLGTKGHDPPLATVDYNALRKQCDQFNQRMTDLASTRLLQKSAIAECAEMLQQQEVAATTAAALLQGESERVQAVENRLDTIREGAIQLDESFGSLRQRSSLCGMRIDMLLQKIQACTKPQSDFHASIAELEVRLDHATKTLNKRR